MSEKAQIQPGQDIYEKEDIQHHEIVPVDTNDPEKGGPDHHEEVITEEDNKRVRRKADMYFMPFLCIIFGFQYLDKICIGYAAVMSGFFTDNGLTGDQFAWLGSIFWFGYMVGSYPMMYLLQRIPLSVITAVNAIIWGAILCLMAVGKTFKGLMAVRFFLGIFESSISAALILYTSQWYKPREQGTRSGIWLSFSGSGNIIGGSVAWALAKRDTAGTLSIPGWKVVFILFGCCTIFIGFLFLFFVPSSPDTAWFLNKHERKIALQRVGKDHAMKNVEVWKWKQVLEAAKEPVCWLYCFIALISSIPNGGITVFFGQIIKGFGYDTYDTLLLGMANTVVAFYLIVFLWLGDRFKNRLLIGLIPPAISTIGLLMVWLLPTDHKSARLGGYYLLLTCTVAYGVSTSLLATNVHGRTKKSAVNGTYFFFFCAGNLIGPQIFRAKDYPRYEPALAVLVAVNIMVMLCFVVVYFLYRRENAKRDRLQASTGKMEVEPGNDMTDGENLNFRYVV